MPEVAHRIIVVGGGISGLAAASELGRRGFEVVLLEARTRLGGRIFTTRPKGWSVPVELGAQFIHAGNPALWRKLKSHRLGAQLVPTSHWRFDGRQISEIEDVGAEIGTVTGKIKPRLMRGWSFAEFLHRYRTKFTEDERQVATSFVEGFEAAPADRMSAIALAGESIDTSEQFVVKGGYDRLVESLEREARQSGVQIHVGCVVGAIEWGEGRVTARTSAGVFTGESAVVTLPLGVLQAKRRQRGHVDFQPPLREKRKIAAQMGMGHVIRITIRFEARVWRVLVPEKLSRRRGGFGFIHSRMGGVPVWWSLSGQPVLTGWAGGPAAQALATRSPGEILERALASLATIWGVPKKHLRRAVAGHATHNWSRDPFSRGAYSFVAAGQDTACEALREPVAHTLFFAGEAPADGAETGTVHGALASGLRAAEEVRAALKKRG